MLASGYSKDSAVSLSISIMLLAAGFFGPSYLKDFEKRRD
jgi:hypothetical protein